MDDGYIRMIHDQSCHLNLSHLRVSTVYLSVFGCDPQHCSKTCTQVQRFKFNCEGWCFHWGPWPFLAQGPCRCNHTLHIFRPCTTCVPLQYGAGSKVKCTQITPIFEFSVMLMSSTLQGCGKYSAFHSLSEPSKPTSRIRGWRWVLAHNPNYYIDHCKSFPQNFPEVGEVVKSLAVMLSIDPPKYRWCICTQWLHMSLQFFTYIYICVCVCKYK